MLYILCIGVQNNMKLNDWCKKQGINYHTGYRWFKKGIIPNAKQMTTGTILIDDDIKSEIKNDLKVYVYCRVSNNSRKKDLNNQVKRCLEFCTARGYEVIKVYKEIASGMNDKRKQLWKLLDNNPVKIIVEHKDRLTRFGFEYIEKLLKKQNCELIVINRDKEDESDLIKDLVSIISSFCCRLYGLRRGQKKSKKMKEILND